MKRKKTGLYTHRYYFTLKEEAQYIKYKQIYNGYYQVIYINNGYCLEVTKRVITL